MPAAIGVANLFGLSAPAGGHVHESSSEQTRDVATVKSAAGVTVIAVPKKLITTNVSIKGKGDPALAGVTAGALAAGTVKVISAKGSESNDDFPDFEIRGVKMEDAA